MVTKFLQVIEMRTFVLTKQIVIENLEVREWVYFLSNLESSIEDSFVPSVQ